MKLSKKQVSGFEKIIWNYYKEYGRSFAWRKTRNPYQIVVSEFMLQQTQTARVAPKFDQFVRTFVDFASLAHAPLKKILAAWQGLGYNRRALALKKIAQTVVANYDGMLPQDPAILVQFSGIGNATAASICAFAFNQPTIFIETNIRTVFLHFFFSQREQVHDNEILPLVAQTVDTKNPREWYYALMDYGVMLKAQHGNPNTKSRHYTKQSKFEGSDRQIRGTVMRLLTHNNVLSIEEIRVKNNCERQRLEIILEELQKEGLIRRTDEDFFEIG